MGTGTIGLLLWLTFFALHFFATQRLYSSSRFYLLTVLLLFLSLSLFIFLNKRYFEQKFQFSTFLIFHYGVLLLLIKLGYRKLNLSFVKKRWVAQTFTDKDFTYVTHAYEGLGNDIWDEKRSLRPSWLDYIFS